MIGNVPGIQQNRFYYQQHNKKIASFHLVSRLLYQNNYKAIAFYCHIIILVHRYFHLSCSVVKFLMNH